MIDEVPTLLILLSPILTMEQVKALYLTKALEIHRWNKTHTAKAIGIDRRTLYRMMLDYKIPHEPPAEPAEPEPLPDPDFGTDYCDHDGCEALATHVKRTLRAGDHFYCREHAEVQEGFFSMIPVPGDYGWCTIETYRNVGPEASGVQSTEPETGE